MKRYSSLIAVVLLITATLHAIGAETMTSVNTEDSPMEKVGASTSELEIEDGDSVSHPERTLSSAQFNVYSRPEPLYKTPEAAAFQKYGSFGTNAAYGSVDISIPIYEVNCRDLKIPISLHYGGNGIKVTEEASWVGLGWDLSIGGCINVVAAGQYDYLVRNAKWNDYQTMLNLENSDRFQTKADLPDYTVMQDLVNGMGERDFYSVNLLGQAFLFFINPSDNSPTIIGDGEGVYSISASGTDGWLIKDIMGYRYEFSAVEYNIPDGAPRLISAYYLSSIETPQGITATFGYEYSAVKGLPQGYQWYDAQVTFTEIDNHGSNTIDIPRYGSGANYGNTELTKPWLKYITTDNQTVTFELSDRTDYKGAKKLDAIKVKDINGSLIFQHHFNYGTFSNSTVGGSFPDILSYLDTDVRNKERLKLLSISQLSTDRADSLTHTFTYTETYPLPLKTSAAIDLWGFYNGQENISVNSTITDKRSLIPSLQDCTLGYNTTYKPNTQSLSEDGACRFSDSNRILSGTLSSVTYPTGGKSVFTFEPHSFKSSPVYPLRGKGYTDVQASVEDNNYPATTTSPGPVTNRTVSVSGKAQGYLTVMFSASGGKKLRDFKQANAYVIVQPMASPTYKAIKISLDSCQNVNMDGTLHQQTFPVSLDAVSYQLIASLPTSIPYGSGYVKATLKFRDINSNLESGGAGLRIAAITNYDKDGSLIGNRSFEYKCSDGNTSGQLIIGVHPTECRRKYFEHVFSRNQYGDVTSYMKGALDIIRINSSMNNGPAITNAVSHGTVAYTRVVEKESDADGNIIRITINDYNVNKSVESLPELHLLSSFGGGRLVKSTVSDAAGNIMQTVDYFYSRKSSRTFKCNMQLEDQYYEYLSEIMMHNHPRYVVRVYPYYSYWDSLLETVTKEYTPHGTKETVSTYTYNTLNHLQSEIQTLTGGVGTKISYKYPVDYSVAPYATMSSDAYHLLGIPVETISYDVYNGNSTEAQKMKCNFYFNPTQKAMLQVSSIQESVKGGAYSTREAFTYSTYGNTLGGITKDSSDKCAYLWSYHHTCPVALIEGASYSEVLSWAGANLVNSLANAADLSDSLLSQLRTALAGKNVTLTTFSYKPLVGIISVTESNGKKTSYTYDTFNRLSKISDHYGRTLKIFSYDHHNQHGPKTTVKTMLNNTGTQSVQAITYHNGLGYAIQTVQTGINTSALPVVTYSEPDPSGNPKIQWLPFAVSSGTVSLSKSNVASSSAEALSDSKAYSEITYDALGRPTYVATPGLLWHNASKGKSTIYSTNIANSVKIYRADVNGNGVSQHGYWSAKSLTSEKNMDEDGLSIETFTDGGGRTILERRGGSNDTYYVYNSAGQLRYVLQPMFSQNADLESYAFEYRYDTFGNLIYKSIPGGGATTYVYDSSRRVTFMQDERLKSKGLHRFFIYDNLGRNVIQGVSSSCDGSTTPNTAKYTGGSSGFMMTGYTLTDNNHIQQATPEVINYYDDYSFVNALDSRLMKTNPVTATGLPTGYVTYNSSGGKSMSAVYYDINGNITSLREITDFGTLRTTDNTYTFTNRLLSSKMTENGVSVLTENGYDTSTGLLLTTDVSVNGTKQRVSKISYDNLGRISSIMRGNGSGSGGTVNYKYNLHGKTTSISGPGFSQTLHYTDGPGTARYNGNVSSMSWMMGSETTQRGYKYTYNDFNWLTQAEYGEGSSLSSNKNKYTEKFLSYNANGCITKMERYGLNADGAYGKVDDLQISYEGNRISEITDTGATVTQTGSMDYPGGSTPSALGYDSAGSIIKDESRDITSIEYDNLGNPTRINLSDGSYTSNIYSAEGVKLESTHYSVLTVTRLPGQTDPTPVRPGATPLAATVKMEYRGPIIYKNGKIDRIMFEGGYATVENDIVTFHYYIKDYLGNNRAVINGSTGTVEQTIAYYPYGGVIADLGSNKSLQPYKFGAKELISNNGLYEYDFGARRYWQAVSTFTSIDPLAEKFYWLSPYVFCANNPINLIDTDGKEPTRREAALMSQYAYKDENMNKAYEELLKTQWSISERDFGLELNQNNGLNSVIFERTTNGVTEYAYVYAGSVPFRDFVEDILQVIGMSSQYSSGIKNAKDLSNKLKYNELTFVGHSLGGGLAACASLATGRKAITFNSAAVSSLTMLFNCLGSDSKKITNYRVTGKQIGSSKLFRGGCMINNFQDNIGFRPPGIRIDLPIGITNSYEAHKIEYIVNYLNNIE